MHQKQKGLMIEGNIWKLIIMFAIPLIIGNLFQQLYNTVDSIVVGQFIGDNALAAVNSSGPIVNMLISTFMGLSIGGTVVLSTRFGALDEEGVEKSIHTSIAFTLTAGVLVTIIGVCFAPTILKLVSVDPEVMDDSILYLRIYFAGIIGLVIYNMGSGLLRAVGDSRSPLHFLIVSSITNIILDLLFVVVFRWGIAGVAIATSIAQFASAFLIVYKLTHTNEMYRLTLKNIRYDKDTFKEIVRIGIPSAIQSGVVSFSNLVVQANVNAFGKVAMAGAGCYSKIDGFAIMPVMSYSQAITTFVGQNLGAKKYDRVKKGARIALILSCGTNVILSIFILAFGPQLLSIFTSTPEVIEMGLLKMRTLVPGYFLLAITHCLSGTLRGAGLTKVPMIVMLLCWCICRVIWVTVTASLFNNIQFVFMAWPITWALSTILLIIYYVKADWVPKEA